MGDRIDKFQIYVALTNPGSVIPPAKGWEAQDRYGDDGSPLTDSVPAPTIRFRCYDCSGSCVLPSHDPKAVANQAILTATRSSASPLPECILKLIRSYLPCEACGATGFADYN